MRLPSEPCRNTCPDINAIQEEIKEIIKDFERFNDTDNPDDFISSMEDASYKLRDIHSILEDLRRSNSDLRDWGHELTQIAENMDSEKDAEILELHDTISAKETEIAKLEDEIYNLQS